MEPEVRERFERIEATLALTAENHRVAMEQLDKRMAAAEKRTAAAEKRMDRFDKSLDGLRNLVVAGMRIVNQLAADRRKDRAETLALKAELRAFIKSQGNGHRGPNGRGRL